jgi:inward rectifier potassium channel
MLFARFSRPIPRIAFSDRALIAPYPGGRAFMFRIANERSSQIVDLEARIVLALFDRQDGHATRQFSVLSLERNRVSLFPLTWTVVHPIDEKQSASWADGERPCRPRRRVPDPADGN